MILFVPFSTEPKHICLGSVSEKSQIKNLQFHHRFLQNRFMQRQTGNVDISESTQCKVIASLVHISHCFPEGLDRNNSRRNFVFLSSTGSQNVSGDQQECSLTPGNGECGIIECTLQSLRSNDMLWIDTIYARNILLEQAEVIFLSQFISKRSHIIRLVCLRSCVLINNLTVYAQVFQTTFVFQVEGFYFENSTVSVGNVHIVFKDSHFVNSVVTDDVEPTGNFQQLFLHFMQTTFENQEYTGIKKGLTMGKMFSAHIAMLGSEFINVNIHISNPNVYLNSTGTSFVGSQVAIDANMLLFSTFHNVILKWLILEERDLSGLKMRGTRFDIKLINCVFERSTGLEIFKADSGLLDSWAQISIHTCAFMTNRKRASGGAVSVQYVVFHESFSQALNFVKITNSSFSHNTAVRLGSAPSQGGALSLITDTTGGICHTLHVHIDETKFINNKATDQGGALFASGKCLEVRIRSSAFEITDKNFDSPKGIFIFSYSDISIEMTDFARDLKYQSNSLLALEMLHKMAVIGHLNITVKCSLWYKLDIETKIIQNQGKHLQILCTSCSASYFAPSDGQFLISFLPNQTSFSVTSTTNNPVELDCMPCPAGANCPGNDLTASPNFWGYRSGVDVTMYQCPIEYCCTNNCTGYNQCSGHRTGVLCGSCQVQYSLSMLSSHCLKDNTCSDYWLWPLVILAVVLYMLWYTTKDVLLSIPSSIAGKVLKCFINKMNDSDMIPVDKGYFSIVAYFAQIKSEMTLTILQNTPRAIDTLFQKVESYINLVFNFELTYVSNDTCAMEGATTTMKSIYKFLFLVGVHLSWNIVFLFFYLLEYILRVKKINPDTIEKFRSKLFSGLLEIIKYTYSGFTSIVFSSLVCISVAGNHVWFYDGSVQCYSEWQRAMIMFGLTYILPYPFLFWVGIKLIKSKIIAGKSFFIACCFPLPFLLCWCFLLVQKPTNQHASAEQTMGKIESVVYEGLKGGFRQSESGTEYWEGVLMFRRLLIGVTILIPDASIQLCICLALCIAFLVHHLYQYPFEYHLSNNVETLSLSLLCGVAAINLYKASFLYDSSLPIGQQRDILVNLELLEAVFVVLIVVFIACCEITIALGMRTEKLCAKLPKLSGVSPKPLSPNDRQIGNREHSTMGDTEVDLE